MRAGTLRHRITIQRKTETVDPVTGYREWTWTDLVTDYPASWLPGPGREFLASEALRSEVQGRFEGRWDPAVAQVTAADRVLWDSKVYDIKANPLVDATARREVTLMVARGLNEG
ncbi:MAG: head-tail adaptor protein [Variovorax sp.]